MNNRNPVDIIVEILSTEFPDEPEWSLVVLAKQIIFSLDRRRSAYITE